MKRLLPLCLCACLLAFAAFYRNLSDAPASSVPSPSSTIAPERVHVAVAQASAAPMAQAAEEAPALFLNVFNAQTGEVAPMDLELYVSFAVAGEMPASFDLEALKAQAVAARSYALWKSALFGGGGCSKGEQADVCTDSTHCMAYSDEQALKDAWGEGYAKNWTVVTQAVKDTAGLVCAYDGEPIQALFHAISGGRTEDAVAVFQNALPYLTSVESGGEEEAEKYEAEQRFARKALAKTLNDVFPEAVLSADKLEEQLVPLSRTTSGRVESLRLGETIITGRQFRQALSLNSTNFTLSFSKDTVTIHTIGYGHGVGMSQVGANAMAAQGADFAAILTHYYSGVEILPAGALLEE